MNGKLCRVNLLSAGSDFLRWGVFFLSLCLPSMIFSQALKWSQSSTWDSGVVPQSMENVIIPKGKVVLLDIEPPPLGSIHIKGTLIFDEKDINLVTSWIHVDGGELQIGRSEYPTRNKISITLVGASQTPHETFGTCFIAVSNKGAFSIHGSSAKKESWLPLDITTLPRDSVIYFDRNLPWEPGDELVLVSSSFDPKESERLRILESAGHKFFIDPPAQYIHWGRSEKFNEYIIDERAEVGLLSRNIVIQVDEASKVQKRGLTFKFVGEVQVSMEGVELRDLGNPREQEGYGLHWKYEGEVPGSFISNCSFHRAYHHAVVLDGLNGLSFTNNVLYEGMGSALTVLNGENNRIVRNLGAYVQKLNGNRSVIFFSDNAKNIFTGNRAVGAVEGNGFEFAFSDTDQFEKFSLQFFQNVAHSNYTTLTSSASDPEQTKGNGFLFRYVGENLADPFPDLPISQVSAFKNSTSGLFSSIPRTKLNRGMFTNNGMGVIASDVLCSKSMIKYTTANEQGSPLDFGANGGALHLIADGEESIKINLTGLQVFGQPGPNILIEHAQVEPISAAYGLKLNRKNAIRFPNLISGALIDLDGSLTGSPSVLVGSDPGLITPNCTYLNAMGAYSCALDEYIYLEMENGQGQAMPGYDMIGANGSNALSGKIGSKVTSFVLADQSYLLNIKAAIPKQLSFRFEGAPGKSLQLQIPFDKKTSFVLEQDGKKLLPVPTFEHVKNGSNTYFLDIDRRVLYVKIGLGESRSTKLNIFKGSKPSS